MLPEGPVAWVTGAAGGIGQATVARLVEAGFQVEAADLVTPSSAEAGPVRWSHLDATDEHAVAAAAMELAGRHPGLSAVVHLVGSVGAGPLASTLLADWNRLLEVNLTSAFLVARASQPLLRAGHGVLVLASSTNGLNGGSALSGAAYAAAKGALVNLTRYLAREWAPDGIRVNCVAPGPVDTPMLGRLDAATRRRLLEATPLGRLASADDVARVVVHLCGDAGTFLTGTVHNVSGGLELD